MRSVYLALTIATTALQLLATTPTYRVSGTDAKPWARIFGSVGMVSSGDADPAVVVAGTGQQVDIPKLAENHIVVLEGNSAGAQSLGFAARNELVEVRRIC